MEIKQKIKKCIKQKIKLNAKLVGTGVHTHSYNKGITIIALIITIILMLILAGVTVTVALNGGLFDSAREAKFKTELSQAVHKFNEFLYGKSFENIDFESTSLMIGKNGMTYNTKKPEETGNIYTVLENIPREYSDSLEVIKGEMYYSNSNEKKQKWAQDLGLKISPYKIVEGVLLSANDNLALLDEDTGALVIPNSVTSIGEGAFTNVQGLKTIIIPANVKEIQKNAFNGNTTLEKVIFETEIKDGVEEGTEIIGENAFMGCVNLASIEMPDTVKEIGSSAFAGCGNLNNIKISENLKVISTYAFSQCVSLESIDIPEGVTSIEGGAFNLCKNLKEIYIPSTVENMTSMAFIGCNKLNNIKIANENRNFSFEDGILFNADKTEIIYILPISIASNQTTFTVPNTVTKLTNSLINSYTQIQKVVIPASTTNISMGFFTTNIKEVEIDSNNPNYVSSDGKIYNKDRTMLYLHYLNKSNVVLEEGITTITGGAFGLCSDLENITLPNSLTRLDAHAIGAATKLTSVTLGPNVSNINPLAFYGSALRNINIDDRNNYYTAEGTAIYNKDKTRLVCVVEKVTEFNIPEGVKEIESSAFHNQRNLTNVTIPNTVTTIGNSFNHCASLTSIEIPNSVQTIHTNCFSNSNNLTQIIIDKEEGSIQGSPWGCRYGDRAVTWKR